MHAICSALGTSQSKIQRLRESIKAGRSAFERERPSYLTGEQKYELQVLVKVENNAGRGSTPKEAFASVRVLKSM